MSRTQFQLDITERLENRASTLYGGAYAVMTEASKEIIRLRAGLANKQVTPPEVGDLPDRLSRLSGTVHSNGTRLMLEARDLLLTLSEANAIRQANP